MVMITRSARRRACEIFDGTRTSSENSCNVPPWCSSGKTYERIKPRTSFVPEYVNSSPYLQPRYSWAVPCKDKGQDSSGSRKRRAKVCRARDAPDNRCWVKVAAAVVVAVFVGTLLYFRSMRAWQLRPRNEIFSIVGIDKTSTAVDEQCCYKMKQLTAALLRVEQTLRRTRKQHTLMLTSQSPKSDNTAPVPYMNVGSSASVGGGTAVWGGRAALWGVVPLWRASPPPSVLLAAHAPAPKDCWPFSGSRGEVIIELSRRLRVRSLSVEHIRPDAARSAPRHFVLYGILENGTWLKALSGEYRYDGPAKQMYTPLCDMPPVNRVGFRVLSNHGNKKYTCVYRVHIYGD